MTTRKTNWQLDFEKTVSEHKDKAFIWGEHDCVLWAANAVLAITGFDAAEGFRDSYSTALGAAKLLKDFGGMEALVTTKLEREPVAPAFANIGDVLLVLQEGQPMLAICNGETMLAPGLDGLVALPTLSALKAWKV
jgi:hypothetical protein